LLNIIAGTLSSPLVIVPNSYESIATVTVGAGGAADVTFSSIPSTYEHLQIRGIARDNRSSAANMMKTWVNNDTSANYTDHWLYGDGASVSAFAETTGQGFMQIVRIASANATSGVFGTFVMDIFDYKSTSKYKTFRTLTGYDNNGSGLIYLTSGLWLSTSAINRIDFAVGAAGGTLISQYSSFALYGIKGV
jgi:hypothetical protein